MRLPTLTTSKKTKDIISFYLKHITIPSLGAVHERAYRERERVRHSSLQIGRVFVDSGSRCRFPQISAAGAAAPAGASLVAPVVSRFTIYGYIYFARPPREEASNPNSRMRSSEGAPFLNPLRFRD
ncbi:hypothetical protein EVAR_3327_1 [Eumeta japonica]|uniref:Uncharacterized protein n=1 Tax=Eumeta variegata TaxID=151549 RepID=A0A4C1SVB2_EUMVA|nr:hypothetical protein EVAR_3327_1 [Eumeta japonica]